MKTVNFVIGIDGGGTKTVAALADFRGFAKRRITLGASNPNKVGIDLSISILGEAIKKVSRGIKRSRIDIIYVALAGSLERDLPKRKQIKKLILKKFPEFYRWRKKIKIEGDQKAAFRSGTDDKDGVVLIAGTGSIAMGWRGKQEAIAGGWDYIMGDQGSAFWLGQKVLQQVCKELDGRESKAKYLKNLVFKRWRVKNGVGLIRKAYQGNVVEQIASLAQVAEEAARKKDRIALGILRDAGEELALSAKTVIKRLDLDKKKFPCVLIGGVFKSGTVSLTARRDILRSAPRAHFVFPKYAPVVGAVKLALEKLPPHHNED